jgi:RNA polymerase sigma-70 factor (ECF subfamily)
MHGRDPDLELWQRAQQRDERAYEQLRRKYRPLVRGELRKRLYAVNEEDLQDLELGVWLSVWNGLANFRGQATFSTWVAAITKNVAYEWLRHKRAESAVITCVVQDLQSEREEASEREAVAYLAVHEAIKNLAESEREVNHLRYFLQLTDEEVAQRLGLPLGTVKSRLRAGLIKLRAALNATAREEKQ